MGVAIVTSFASYSEHFIKAERRATNSFSLTQPKTMMEMLDFDYLTMYSNKGCPIIGWQPNNKFSENTLTDIRRSKSGNIKLRN